MDLELHSQEVTLKNISPLNLTTLLETSFPFFVSVNDKPRSHTMVRAVFLRTYIYRRKLILYVYIQ